MRKIFFGLIAIVLFLTLTSAKAQTDPAEQKIGKFYGTVIAVDSATKIATVLSDQMGHVIEIDASGLEREFGPLEKNVNYWFAVDRAAVDCSTCRVQTQARAVAYHISPKQAEKNIARLNRFNVPQRARK